MNRTRRASIRQIMGRMEELDIEELSSQLEEIMEG
jgi:hypothetical protein